MRNLILVAALAALALAGLDSDCDGPEPPPTANGRIHWYSVTPGVEWDAVAEGNRLTFGGRSMTYVGGPTDRYEDASGYLETVGYRIVVLDGSDPFAVDGEEVE